MGAMTIADRIAAKRGQIAANKSKGLRPYKFKAGKTKFRILPAVDPDAAWDRRFGVHYLKSFDKKSFLAIGDRDITYGQADSIRELIFEAMRAAGDQQDLRDHYREMLARPRVVFNALILDDKDQAPTEPVLIEVSETAFDTILAQFEVYTDMDPNYDLAGAKTGHIFTCEKTGSGLDTEYTFLATPQKAPLKDEIIAKGHDLDAWLTSLFEAKDQKALEFIAKLNAAAGLPTVVTAQLSAPAAAPVAAIPSQQSNVSAAAVTTAIEPEDTPFEEIAQEAAPAAAESPFEDEPAPAAAPVTAPVAPQPAASPAASAPAKAEVDEIESILAGLS